LRVVTGGHVQPIYWARLADGAVYQDVRERLKASFVVDKPRSALVGERIDQRAFRKAITITAALSLLLGLFVIYNAFSLALVERVREIGLFSAIGLTAGEIGAAVLIEGIVLALFGAVAGLGSLRSVGELKVWHAAGLSDRLPAQAYHVANELRQDAATHFVLGWLMGAYRMTRYRSGRMPEAEVAMRRALELSPTYSWGHYYLGCILLAQGRREAALAAIQQETPDGGRDVGLAIVFAALSRSMFFVDFVWLE